MVPMLAALTCLFSSCESRPQLARGLWEVRIETATASCQGFLSLEVDDAGNVEGSMEACQGQSGYVTGTLRSNELVLQILPEGSQGRPLLVRVSVVGNYLSGAMDEGVVEGWRGEAPVGSPDSGTSTESRDDLDSETV